MWNFDVFCALFFFQYGNNMLPLHRNHFSDGVPLHQKEHMSCCHQAELVSKRVWLAHLNKQRDCSTTRPLDFACLWQTSGCYLWSSSLSHTRYWAAFFRNTYETFIVGCHDHNNKWQQQRVEIFMQTLVESENSLVVQLTLRSVNRGWGVTQDGDKAGGLEFVQNVWGATTQEAGCFT